MASALLNTMRKRSSMLGVSKDTRRALVFQQRESLNLLCCGSHVAGVAHVVAVARVVAVAQARRDFHQCGSAAFKTLTSKISLRGLAQSFLNGKPEQH